jgi:hypothetical protein
LIDAWWVTPNFPPSLVFSPAHLELSLDGHQRRYTLPILCLSSLVALSRAVKIDHLCLHVLLDNVAAARLDAMSYATAISPLLFLKIAGSHSLDAGAGDSLERWKAWNVYPSPMFCVSLLR